MGRTRLRRQIAAEAAKLLAAGRETDYTVAKRRAARILGVRFSATDFPSTREIRDACKLIEELSEQGRIQADPLRMKLAALDLMHLLRSFSPRLMGPLARDEVSTGTETIVDVEATTINEVSAILADSGRSATLEESGPAASAPYRIGVLSVEGMYPVKLRVVRRHNENEQGMSLVQLRDLLSSADQDMDATIAGLCEQDDRFEALSELLDHLESIAAPPDALGAGDALHHALQLFELVQAEHPYDEELLTAALTHDVGYLSRGSDPRSTAATLLEGLVTRRTGRLIEGLNALTLEPALSDAALVEIVGKEEVEDVRLLASLNLRANKSGRATMTASAALDYLRQLESGTLWKSGDGDPPPDHPSPFLE